MVHEIPIELGGHIFPTSMIILKNQGIDVILGMNWMYQRGAVIDALHRTIRLNLPVNLIFLSNFLFLREQLEGYVQPE
jgi:hypothetical protein